MDSIEKSGLPDPVIVRPAGSGKYEVICGHDRAKAVRTLGRDVITADIRYGMSDTEALELFLDSSSNQPPFPHWDYPQRFEAVKYAERVIRETSRQGKRTDLGKETEVCPGDVDCVSQTRQKLKKGSREATARDRVTKQLDISTATFGKYRRLLKLPDNLLQPVAQLLDKKRITFEAAYIISNLRDFDIKYLIAGMEKKPDAIIDMDELKELPNRNTEKSGEIYPTSKKRILKVLKPQPSSGIITPVMRKK